MWRGSSPLARGLPGPRGSQGAKGGIIPARAGFTHLIIGSPTQSRDHPRSRGVYRLAPRWGASRRGSSPLARGLRTASASATTVGRIIPARAGFTYGVRFSDYCRSDHPRSRGVYERESVRGLDGSGSSPLARGLHNPPAVGLEELRIIPARAGFTGGKAAARSMGRDHPRSRGVYVPDRGRSAAPAGSSPLARGLHAPVQVVHGTRRIIPARAGFTTVPGTRSPRRADHPRSRGVY